MSVGGFARQVVDSLVAVVARLKSEVLSSLVRRVEEWGRVDTGMYVVKYSGWMTKLHRCIQFGEGYARLPSLNSSRLSMKY